MSIFINGIGMISPQKTFGNDFFWEQKKSFTGHRMTCTEPAYSGLIDQKSIRRMSRIIRMGVASAMLALKEASVKQPDAIITGTALGCLEDTATFLSKMIVNEEQALNPTPFMQSTHNTIGSQIALLLGSTGYNQTYVHRAFSFESVLVDAMMMLDENNDQNILAGGVDEITDASHKILSRFGLFRKGMQHGEGSGYFLFAGKQTANAYARLRKVSMIYKAESKEWLESRLKLFLQEEDLTIGEVDLALTGDHERDDDLFGSIPVIHFKNLCGEYPTSSAFALWLASMILKRQSLPAGILATTSVSVKNILIVNSYFGIHHSFILVEAC
jgi:3-oxoacyl-[acyl-carrier-protein] synthase II